jgi:hypothetical protein
MTLSRTNTNDTTCQTLSSLQPDIGEKNVTDKRDTGTQTLERVPNTLQEFLNQGTQQTLHQCAFANPGRSTKNK